MDQRLFVSTLSKTLQLPSVPKSILRVESLVESTSKRYQIKPDLQCNILISLTEAVNNAIIHGNGQDAEKQVLINILQRDGLLTFQVSDEGTGFDPTQIPDPTAPENLRKLGGRGVFLIRQLADDVRFLNNGSTVEIAFRIRE